VPAERKGLFGAVPLAHRFLRERLRPGDRAVDATCGNGHDTLLLGELVGPEGRVWGFDLQEKALAATSELLREKGLADRVALVHAGHERLAEFVTEPLRAAVFNLGYLPGGETSFVTRPETTLTAFDAVLPLLLPGGIVIVVLYTGHSGGPEEEAAVTSRAAGLDPLKFNVWSCRQGNRSAAAPYLLLVEKI
jgi:predicted methyltransferase